MEVVKQVIDVFLHLDSYLNTIIETFGIWTYFLLFLIIFLETGVVIAPFLPGDSLIFAAGTFAAIGSLNIWAVYISLFLAAILGDSVNYFIGYTIGTRLVGKQESRFIKKEYLIRTQEFYEKYGGKTIILARFIPIIRTFAPFVAGVAKMHYGRFIFFNVIGGFIWVTLFLWGGYFFGNLPVVQENFSLVIGAIIVVSLVPTIIEIIRRKI